MKPISKMNYNDCKKLFINNDEVELFFDNFLDRDYLISLEKTKNNAIIIKANGEEIVWLTPDEFGVTLIKDPQNVHMAYKVNLANLFINDGYRIATDKFKQIFMFKKSDGYRYPINKLLLISFKGKKIYTE